MAGEIADVGQSELPTNTNYREFTQILCLHPQVDFIEKI